MRRPHGKYVYYRVIQENWGTGWDDVDHHETNSRFVPLDRALWIDNWRAYNENSQAKAIRWIRRRELHHSLVGADRA